jgi:hypothetical protein
VQSFGREDMGFHALQNRLEHGTAGSHMVGQGRQAERHAFTGIALGLPVERLMLAELLEQGSSPAGSVPPNRGQSHGTALVPD